MADPTSTPDPQNWVFPPRRAQTNGDATVFGPVRMQDRMILDWAPSTKPEVYSTCFSNDVETTLLLVSNQAPPVTVQIADRAKTDGDNTRIFCHFWFADTTDGNTVVWEFLNEPRAASFVWAADSLDPPVDNPPEPSSSSKATETTNSTTATRPVDGASSTATTRTVASSPTTREVGQPTSDDSPISTPTSATTTTTSTITNASTTNNSTPGSGNSGLSTGASAGVGIAVGLTFLALGILLFYLWRRRRRHYQQSSLAPPTSQQPYYASDEVPDKGFSVRGPFVPLRELPASVPVAPAELHGSGVAPVELPSPSHTVQK